jgi:hypothetical protein
MNGPASPAIAIISAMITPALLILGSASLVATALQRLARAVDRARLLLQTSEADALRLRWDEASRERWLRSYEERSLMAERAVRAFFVAIGTFVFDGLSIAADHYSGDVLTWLPVSLTVLGMLLMLSGAVLMVRESQLAIAQIRDELQTRHGG